MRTLLLGTVCLTALTFSATTSLAKSSAEEAAYDTNSKPVYDSHGGCVRTKWMGDNDPCGVAPKAEAPKKKFVPVPTPAPKVPEVELEQRTVYFDFNNSTLGPRGRETLDALATTINESSAVTDVSVHGFTDQFGASDYNDKLAGKRANAVKAYLDGKTSKPISADVRGLGKASATDGCDSGTRAEKIACMAKERRVEIELKATK